MYNAFVFCGLRDDVLSFEMIQTDLGRYGISWKPLSSCGTGIKLNPAD